MNHQPDYLSFIEKNKAQLVAIAADLIRINTVQSNETTAARLLEKKLRPLGFTTQLIGEDCNRLSLVADIGQGERVLMLNGHLDTVAFGDVSRWREHPLSGQTRGNRLYGRGAYDMKSSVAAATFAAIALINSKINIAGKLRLVFNADEEGAGCSGIKQVIKAGLLGDACIVGEPMSAGTIGIGARGCYRFELLIRGKSGHTSQKNGGINAVTKMAKALLTLEKLRFKHMKHPLFAPPNITPGTLIAGGTGINVYPAECRAAVDVRLSWGMSKASVKKQIVACLDTLANNDPEFDYRIKDLVIMNPALSDSASPVVTCLTQAVENHLGRTPKQAVMSGGSDANFLINAGVPCVIYGVDGDNIHAENEYALIPGMVRTCKIYASTVVGYFSS